MFDKKKKSPKKSATIIRQERINLKNCPYCKNGKELKNCIACGRDK